MGKHRGFTLIELLVAMGIIFIVAAVALPGMRVAIDRNKVITSSELVAAQLRDARLAAITRNVTFRVAFDCPGPGAIRMLRHTGFPAIDNSPDRCLLNQLEDGPAVYLPPGISFGDDTPPTIRVTGRGQFVLESGDPLPRDFTVSYGSFTRTLTVTAAGRVSIPTS